MSKEPIQFLRHIADECAFLLSMRDRLIHDYIGVNYSIVWDVFKNKIPKLNSQIQEVLESS
jgi:uncharacterized protein with HEPN domain